MNPIFGQRIYDIYCFSGEESSAEDNNADSTIDISSCLARDIFCYSGEETETQERNESSHTNTGSYFIGSGEDASRGIYSHSNPAFSTNNNGFDTNVHEKASSNQSSINQTSKKRINFKDKKNNKRKKVRWTKELDIKLLNAVEKYGQKWPSIALFFKDKKARQCRERWCNYVNPRISKESWGSDEDALIAKERRKKKGWKAISEQIELLLQKCRPPNAIKNHWNTTLKNKYENNLMQNQQISGISSETRSITNGANSVLLNLPWQPQNSLQNNFG